MAGLWEVTPLAANWEKILLTYLHDPPDKALAIRGHVDRARRYAAIVVGEEESRRLEEAATTADPLASAVERLPSQQPEERASGPLRRKTANCVSSIRCRPPQNTSMCRRWMTP
jgi:hypothetical protein